MMKQADFDWSGRLLGGRFHVDTRLEAGAFLFSGRDDETGAPVSLLILPRGDAEAGATVTADLAHLIPPVEHESLPRARSAVAIPGEPLVVAFEHLPGESWRAFLGREGRQTEQEAATIADRVLAGLEHAHAARIPHGSLYPGFVLIQNRAAGPTGVRLVGFGLPTVSSLVSPPLEAAAYVAPELARSRRPEVGADLYAVGAMLYHALGGQPPYATPSRSAALYALLTGPPPPLEGLVPELAPGLLEVVKRATLRRPQGRFGSAAEMRKALSPWVRSRSVALSPPPAPIEDPVAANADFVASAAVSAPAQTPAPLPAGELGLSRGPAPERTPAASSAPKPTTGPTPTPPTEPTPARRSRRGLIAALLGTVAALLLVYLLVGSPKPAPPIGPPAAALGSPKHFDLAGVTAGHSKPFAAAAHSDAGTKMPANPSMPAALDDARSGKPGHAGTAATGLLLGEAELSDRGHSDGGDGQPTRNAGSVSARDRTAARRRRRRRQRRRRRPLRRRRGATSAPRTARLAVMETRRLYGLARVHRLVLAFARRVNRCFTRGGLERRDRRLYGWRVRVDARGRVRSVRGLGQARGRRRLDRCMGRLLGGIAWGRPERGRSGSFDLHFSSRVSSRR